MYVYIHNVLAQVAAWRANLARRIVVRLNRAVHRLTVIDMKSMCWPIHDAVTTGASFLATINSAIVSPGERRRMTDIHMNNVKQLIRECPPNDEDAQFAYLDLKATDVYSRTDRQTIIDAIADLMRPRALSVRRDPAMLGWTRPHEQFQSCKWFCTYITAYRWKLIKDPKAPIERLYTIFASQAFEIGLRNPLNTTIVRMLAIACVSGRPITRDTFWDRVHALKQVFYAWRLAYPCTMWYVNTYPCSATSFAELYPDCYPGSGCPVECPLNQFDMDKFVQAMPLRGYESTTGIVPQSTIDGRAPPTSSASPLIGVTPKRSSSDIHRETEPVSLPNAASPWRSESETLRETQFNCRGSSPIWARESIIGIRDRMDYPNSAVPSPPTARTDDGVHDRTATARASGTSSAATLDDDLAMMADWRVKQEDRTDTRAVASASLAAAVVDAPPTEQTEGRDAKRARTTALNPTDHIVDGIPQVAIPRNETTDPQFPGTAAHPPICYLRHTIYIESSGTPRARWVVQPHWPNAPRKCFQLKPDPESMWDRVIAFCKTPQFP